MGLNAHVGQYLPSSIGMICFSLSFVTRYSSYFFHYTCWLWALLTRKSCCENSLSQSTIMTCQKKRKECLVFFEKYLFLTQEEKVPSGPCDACRLLLSERFYWIPHNEMRCVCFSLNRLLLFLIHSNKRRKSMIPQFFFKKLWERHRDGRPVLTCLGSCRPYR